MPRRVLMMRSVKLDPTSARDFIRKRGGVVSIAEQIYIVG